MKNNSITITKITDNINSVLTSKYDIKVKRKIISEWLMKKGFIESYITIFGNKRQRITEHGRSIGIHSRYQFIKDKEFGYNMFLYNKEAQQFIIDNLEEILSDHPEYVDIIKNKGRIREAKIPEMEELYVPANKQQK